MEKKQIQNVTQKTVQFTSLNAFDREMSLVIRSES